MRKYFIISFIVAVILTFANTCYAQTSRPASRPSSRPASASKYYTTNLKKVFKTANVCINHTVQVMYIAAIHTLQGKKDSKAILATKYLVYYYSKEMKSSSLATAYYYILYSVAAKIQGKDTASKTLLRLAVDLLEHACIRELGLKLVVKKDFGRSI